MENVIDKILGLNPKKNFECDNMFGKNTGPKGLGQGLGQGMGSGPLNKRQQFGLGQGFRQGGNLNINPQHVVTEIQKLLDRLPEVKNAKGSLNVTFADGRKSTLNLSYN